MASFDFLTWDAEEMVQLDKAHLWHHITNHKAFDSNDPMIVVEGDGLRIKDIRGREYLDCTSGGVWCVNVGYGRESMAKAVYDQLMKLCYYAGSAGNIPTIKFAQKLIEKLPGQSKVYFSNSGSEANEKAFKMIRQLSAMKFDSKKFKILYRDRDYHGTTIATLSATGQFERKNQFGPFVEGFSDFPSCLCYRCPFGKEYGSCDIDCARSVEDAILKEGPDTVGAIIVEPITAGGGVIPPVKEYYPIVQEICRKYDVKIIMDEVVCGIGRTGKWFGHQHYDVDPDIVTMAKGLASSYGALSATVAKQDIFDEFKAEATDKYGYFRDISTFGGCASSTAAALENMRIIEEENLLENTTKMGDYLMDRLNELRDFAKVGDVRGKGLFAGVEFVQDKKTREPVEESFITNICSEIAAQNVLVGRANRSNPGFNNYICLSPALIATKTDIDMLVDAIRKACEKYAA